MIKHIITGDGKLNYTDIGTGRPIVFLHGGPGMTHEYLNPFINEVVKSGFRAITFDQRGSGQSDNFSLETISVDNIVGDIEAIRKNSELNKIIIFGHSFGTYLAQKYADKYPENVEKLILCSSSPNKAEFFQKMTMTMSERMNMNKEMFDTVNEAMITGDEKIISDYMMKSVIHQIKDRNLARKFWNLLQTHNFNTRSFAKINRLLMYEYIQSLESFEYTCAIETLFFHGDFDAIPLESTISLASSFSNLTIEVIADSGHYPFLEQPDEVISKIKAFLS